MNSGTAVITGASGGIGAAFARRLAERGMSLLLVARQVPALQALAAELDQAHGVAVDHLSADLATPEGIGLVEERVAGLADLELLVNGAGFGTAGRFAGCDLASQLRMIELHVTAPTRLCYAALKPMLARQGGSIINVSSLLAVLPFPNNVTYSGSKAYLIDLLSVA